MCYAVIELPKILWGCGLTKKEAVTQARSELSDYTDGREELRVTRRREPRSGDFVVLRCSSHFLIYSRLEHGGLLDLRIVHDRVMLPEEFGKLTLIYCDD
jgi:hypothetical protein